MYLFQERENKMKGERLRPVVAKAPHIGVGEETWRWKQRICRANDTPQSCTCHSGQRKVITTRIRSPGTPLWHPQKYGIRKWTISLPDSVQPGSPSRTWSS